MTSEKKTLGLENCTQTDQCKEEYMHDERQIMEGKPSLLMHSCCGPCSTACIERMASSYEITVYFYNPNITDREEYKKRLDSQIKFIKKYNENTSVPYKVAFIEGNHDTDSFLDLCSSYCDEPEGGKRCGLCFEMRLEKTAQTAALMKFDAFTTTLTVSPHKDSKAVFAIGRRLSDKYKVSFLEEDFKKKNGFTRSVQLAKEYGLYRQDFCGCEYSRAEAIKRRERNRQK